MKMKFKRFLSGVMAVATLASVIVQPVAVSASELEPEEIPFEQQYAELKDVQNSLDSDEIVAANDIELAYGQEFEVEVDLSGIEGVDENKMKIYSMRQRMKMVQILTLTHRIPIRLCMLWSRLADIQLIESAEISQ